MNEYKMIDENIVSNKNGIAYIYKLDIYNTLFSKSVALMEKAQNDVSEIVKSLYMPVELLLIPVEISTSDLSKRYIDLEAKLSDDVDKKNLQRYAYEQIKNYSRTKKYKYEVYLIVKEQINNGFKHKRTLLTRTISIDKGVIKRAKAINSIMFSQITKISKNASKLELHETKRLLEYLSVPISIDESVDNYVVEENSTHLKYIYEDSLGKQKEMFSMISEVNEFPKEVKEFHFVRNIQYQNFPIDIVIKVEPNFKNVALEKKMVIQKNVIKESMRKYERDVGYKLEEYAKKIDLAKQGTREFENRSNYMLETQMFVRVHSSSLELMGKRYEKVKEIFSVDKIKIINGLSRHYTLSQHIMPLNILETAFHNLSRNYFNKFSLQMGSEIGTSLDTYDSILKFYTTTTKRPVFNNDFLPILNLKDVNVSASNGATAYIGTSGSGKSQMLNNDVMSNMICYNSASLLIDPKGDRKDFSKKMNLINSEKYINEIVIGRDNKHKGALNPFDLLSEDEGDYSVVKTFISSLIKVILKESTKIELYDNVIISLTVEEYIRNSVEVEDGQLNFEGFLNVLRIKNREMCEVIESYSDFLYINLFFSTPSTKKLKFTDKMNLIIFDAVPNTNNKKLENEQTNEKVFFKFVLSNVEMMIKEFMRSQNKPFEVTIEEIGFFENATGSNISLEILRLIRSFGGIGRVCSQNFSDIKHLLNNISQIYIGTLASKEEFNYVCDEYELNKVDFSFLRTKNSDRRDEDKFNFLYIDHNQRKEVVKQEFIPMFEKAFDTKVVVENE